MVRRHELEKESLLDTLERMRAENAELHARHGHLTSDLHAEVTRVLELERELERRDSREVTLIGQIQVLESELVELRYLDHQLNTSAEQDSGLGGWRRVYYGCRAAIHASLKCTPGKWRFLPACHFESNGIASAVLCVGGWLDQTKHRSTRSEAFMAGCLARIVRQRYRRAEASCCVLDLFH